MLRTYRAVFREPGTAAFCAAGFVMRMPIAIYPIGLVLLISTRTGHYGFAGLLSGTWVGSSRSARCGCDRSTPCRSAHLAHQLAAQG